MKLSQHAAVRAQQRSIPPLIQQWLLQHGARTYRHGAQIRHFDKKARKVLAACYGRLVVDRLGPLLDSYLVVSENETVITVGHRFKKVQH